MPTSRQFCVALVIVLLCGALAFGQSAPPAAARQLYLLAGTPNLDWGYPSALYRTDGGKLKRIRMVVPESEGVQSIQRWGNVIFLVHPRQVPKTVTIIHTNQPLFADDVVINPDSQALSILLYHLTPAEPNPTGVNELVPLLGGESASNLTLLDVSSDIAVVGSRVKLGSWNEYAALRREGDPGGPEPAQGLFVSVSVDRLSLSVYGSPPVLLDSLPPNVREAANTTASHRFLIIAASQQYLLLKLDHTGEEWLSGKLGDASEMFVHDRARDTWKTIQLEGNDSRSRLFGSWLATVVGLFNRNNIKSSPGVENERNKGGAGGFAQGPTAPFPNVKNAYQEGAADETWLPGILVLQNIDDGRKIRIETGQEDSEILSVMGDIVLYRVNDTIFQARIAGNQLQGTSVVVKDDDVPEIHWVFWGPPVRPGK